MKRSRKKVFICRGQRERQSGMYQYLNRYLSQVEGIHGDNKSIQQALRRLRDKMGLNELSTPLE